MKKVTLTYLQDEVRKVLDEIGINTAQFLVGDIDDENLNAEITSKLIEAVRYVHLNASPARLRDAEAITDAPSITTDSNGIKKGVFTLPADFLRLAKLKLSGWAYPIYMQLDEFSPEYHKQKDKYACGTIDRPMAFLVKVTDALKLECYSCKTAEDTTEAFLWLPEPVVTTNATAPNPKEINICALCETAIVYRIAGLTLTNYDDATKAKTCIELSELNMN